MNMKFLPLLLLTLMFHVSDAQIYQEIQIPPLDRDGYNPVFVDIDGDTDQDIVVLEDGYQANRVYINDGLGDFSYVGNAGFNPIDRNTTVFADIDGDGDQDALLTGRVSSETLTKLYINDGTGNFSETETAIQALEYTSSAFADIDADGDLDLVIHGSLPTGGYDLTLYKNDGMGNFSEENAPFDGITDADIVFADVDADGDQDLLIAGKENIGWIVVVTKLYLNDGLGNFSESQNPALQGRFDSKIAFADIDGDTDQDLFIMGKSGGTYHTNLYTNDGTGIFTEVIEAPFDSLESPAFYFGDIDGDSDEDLLIMGIKNGTDLTKLYTNDGTGNFSEVDDTPFRSMHFGPVEFADIDGDSDLDLLLAGVDRQSQKSITIKRLYTNDGQGKFSLLGHPFEGVQNSSVAFADVDGDNDQDIFVIGNGKYDDNHTQLYFNDGTGVFTEYRDMPFTPIYEGSVAFADVDADNDQDIVISGTTYWNELITELYTNDGFGNYTKVENTPFTGVSRNDLAFADIDNDGDQDLLLTGRTGTSSSSPKKAELYANDGLGNYTKVENTPFTPVSYSATAFADVDGDNDQDLIITGDSSSGQSSKLYINDGLGNFTEMTNTPFINTRWGDVDFADVDGDDDQDVLIVGGNNGYSPSELYLNDGAGNFTEVDETPFEMVRYGSAAFTDADDDGDQDALIMGYNDDGDGTTKLYLNDGTGIFTENTDNIFPGMWIGEPAFVDIDGDTDEDLLMVGRTDNTLGSVHLYENTTLEVVANENVQLPDQSIALLYPNPNSTGIFNLEYFSAINTTLTINVFDFTGKQILQQAITVNDGENIRQFNFDRLQKGAYFMQINRAEKSIILKFIIQ